MKCCSSGISHYQLWYCLVWFTKRSILILEPGHARAARHILGNFFWEVLNGVGVDGVGVIFPFFLRIFRFFFHAFSRFFFFCFSSFSSFFLAFLLFS